MLKKVAARFMIDWMLKKPQAPPEVLDFLRKAASKGGKARAARHTEEELSAWGKKGGRPKGSGKVRRKGAK
jgi:hypothetical protein